ncbi:MAG: glutathione S-transferase N-terminal domain-containing protein [Pseudomonadota bacterium]
MTSPKPVTLYGASHSLYTGRARSYLIKAGVAYREQAMNSSHYKSVVRAKAGGRASLPTLELATGEVIRDGAAIIDHYEAALGHPFSPPKPKHNLISLLFDAIGAEGLLRPAMHYRWNFDADNLAFLEYHFGMLTEPGERGAERAQAFMNLMRNQATPSFGVSADTAPTIEAVYADQLAVLDQHFAAYGYLLGGRPCIGDFGMIAPLFAHLGRDPKPLALMQANAMSVYRWVERMNRPAADLGEYQNQDETWLAGDEIPETLIAVLRVMAEDFVPETLAAADCINAWLADQPGLEPGTECARGVGMGAFELRGTPINALAQPYRFHLLKRVHTAYDALEPDDRAAVDSLLDASGMSPVIAARLSRDIGRHNNLEVWL